MLTGVCSCPPSLHPGTHDILDRKSSQRLYGSLGKVATSASVSHCSASMAWSVLHHLSKKRQPNDLESLFAVASVTRN